MEPTTTHHASATLNVLIVAREIDRGAIAAATHRLDVEVHLRDPISDSGTPEVILIALDDAGDQADALIERHASETPSATIVALSSHPTSERIVRAMRAGATEVLALPVDTNVLGRVLERVAAVRGLRDSAPTGEGHLITVLAPKEGVGATTLVANIGAELGRIHPQQVALVDLDLRHGDLALLLNVDPPQSLADLAHGLESLDAVFVHGSLVRHATGLSLLAASTERSDDSSPLSAAHVERVLALLGATHRVVLVDAPPPLSDAALAAALCSDRVLVPTEPTVPCLRATWRTLEALAQCGIPQHVLDVVVTRHETGEAHLAVDDIANALGRPVHHVVPREDDTACLALNSGRPIADVRPHGPLQQAIAALAATLVPTTHEDAARSMSTLANTL